MGQDISGAGEIFAACEDMWFSFPYYTLAAHYLEKGIMTCRESHKELVVINMLVILIVTSLSSSK